MNRLIKKVHLFEIQNDSKIKEKYSLIILYILGYNIVYILRGKKPQAKENLNQHIFFQK